MTQSSEHRIASDRDIKINRIIWTVMLCCLVASMTVIVMQVGVINNLLRRLDEPARPPQVIRIQTVDGRAIICTLNRGAQNDAPSYKCTEEQ